MQDLAAVERHEPPLGEMAGGSLWASAAAERACEVLHLAHRPLLLFPSWMMHLGIL